MISAFMVTRDAGRWLGAVIANLRRFADEVVVIVDDASTDDTGTVARRLADRAECWPVPGGYAESVRNEAAALCGGDWLWMADDDELVPPLLARHIPVLVRGGMQEFALARRHVVEDAQAGGLRYITSAPWWPDYQTRLRSREAWRRFAWPRQPHAAPAEWNRLLVNVPFWHLKFLLRSRAERIGRMETWGRAWAPALNEHYRRFSLAEEYTRQTEPLDEEAPAELAEMLEGGSVGDRPQQRGQGGSVGDRPQRGSDG